MYFLRPALEADFPAIRSMIYKARINPFGLDWRRFVVACRAGPPAGQEIIGCAQIKPHGDGSRELASLAVLPGWRGQGIARTLIEHFIARERTHPVGPPPHWLYLTCRGNLVPLYEKFGFRAVAPQAMPPYFRRISRIAGLILKLTRAGERMWVMALPLD